jgi:hypothetical protein
MAQPKPFDHRTGTSYVPPGAEVQVLTPEESRQGVISGRVLLILTTSLLLAGIAFLIVYGMKVL